MEVRAGLAGGVLTALEARVVCDRGSTIEWGIEDISSSLVPGPYRWQAYAIRTYAVQTNRVTLGAYRGPGAPPAAFAIESALDELATELGLDPIELRLRNAVVDGDLGVGGRPFSAVGARECLELARDHAIWQERDSVGPTKASASRSATGRAGTSPRPRPVAWIRTAWSLSSRPSPTSPESRRRSRPSRRR